MPLQGASEARRRFRLSECLPKTWIVARRLRQVHAAIASEPFPAGAPSGLVEGPGWIVLPHDPVRALGSLPFAQRLAKALDGEIRLACSRETAPWLSRADGVEPLVLPGADESLRPWCLDTSTKRRPWAWSLDEDPDQATLSGLLWLGGERRIALDRPAYRGVANILLPVPGAGTPRETVRQGLCRRLGIELEPVAPVRRTPGKSLILELPVVRGGGSVAWWVQLASSLSERHSLIVVHAHDLLPPMIDGLRALGNRLSLLRLTRPEDVSRLGGEVKVWIGPLGPAAILASQRDCPLVLIGAEESGDVDFGLSGGPAPGSVRFLSRRKPSPTEVLQAVLDLTPHGM